MHWLYSWWCTDGALMMLWWCTVDALMMSCTRWSTTDSDQIHRGQVEVQRGKAELNFNLAEMDLTVVARGEPGLTLLKATGSKSSLDLDEVALSWSCTRRRTSTLRPSWSSKATVYLATVAIATVANYTLPKRGERGGGHRQSKKFHCKFTHT